MEGQRLFYALPDIGSTFDCAFTALEKHFIPKINVVAEHYKFRQRPQRPDETINQYVAAMREIEEEMLHD